MQAKYFSWMNAKNIAQSSGKKTFNVMLRCLNAFKKLFVVH